MRACYSLDLKLLTKYEQQSQELTFKLNLPIQLMARQLLRYPTTLKMVQLCYGIIIGVDDFEAVDRVCLSFDIDPKNNSLQLNTLILLIQLTTQLQNFKEIVLALQFINAYIRQLIELGEESTVMNLIKRTLVDSLMKLYFFYVEQKVQRDKLMEDRSQRFNTSNDDNSDEHETLDGENLRQMNGDMMNMDRIINGEEDEDDEDEDESIDDGCDQILWELDRFLILITGSYMQNLPTSEALKSLNELLLYFSALNSHVPHRLQNILRDRSVKVLACALQFCKHYEEFARKRYYGGRLKYYIKSIFQNNLMSNFNNTIPESEFVGIFLGNLYYERSQSISSTDDEDDCGDENDSSIHDNLQLSDNQNGKSNDITKKAKKHSNRSRAEKYSFVNSQLHQQETLSGSRLQTSENKEINESEVIDRFEIIFDYVVDFVITRESGVIPSPLERDFIMRFIRILYRNLLDLTAKSSHPTQANKNTNQTIRDTHWFMLLTRLERLFRGSFSRLILFLLSPSDSMNLDERRYFAHKLFSDIEVEKLLDLMEQDSVQSTFILLLTFVKDLLDYSANSQQCSEDGTISEECDEELFDYIEIKLRLLVVILEYELKRSSKYRDMLDLSDQSLSERREQLEAKRARGLTDISKESKKKDSKLNSVELKFRQIWLADLNQTREDSRERARGFMEEKRTSSGGAILASSLTQSDNSWEMDRLVDEAVSITRDVVDDKHALRKIYLEVVKQRKVYNYHIRQQWLSLVIGHTHERAIWHMKEYYPRSWELNPVEGPSRTRRRLRPFKLNLEPRFLRKLDLEAIESSVFELQSSDPLVTSSPIIKTDERAQTDYDQDNASFKETHRLNYSTQSDTDENDHTERSDGRVEDPSRRLARSMDCNSSSENDDIYQDEWNNQYSPHPLCSLILNCNQTIDSNELRIRMFTTDKIHFNCDCSIIRPNEVCEGEVSIASWCIHFIGERSDNYQRHLDDIYSTKRANNQEQQESPKISDRTSNDPMLDSTMTPPPLNTLKTLPRRGYVVTLVEDLWFDEIVEIWDRRYQLKDVGLEIFSTNNMTYLLSFRSNRDREDFKHHLFREQHKMINLQRFNSRTCLNKLTRLWRDGKLTNFDYLTCLNKLSGRSFNDLMQYPVFPFILSDYVSDVLDLTNPDSFRKLDRPMAVQNKNREEVFKKNYQLSQANLTTGPLGLTKAYHYGNHYSNSATVLHFLVRLPPFTQMLIQYQDNNFDQPDRTFHSIANTWQLITRDSNTDFKELIPEFFFLPEMFTNIERLELGKKQNNELVDDVRLPPWCPGSDARLFTLIHRQALETAHVSENLHHWIDLIFGYKQTGKAAIEALNVFHPATYYGGIDLSGGSQAVGLAPGGSGAGSLAGTAAPSIASGSSLALMINNATIPASISTRSSKYDSDYISDTDSPSTIGSARQQQQNQSQQMNGSGRGAPEVGGASSSVGSGASSPRKALLRKHNQRLQLNQQADIERDALETMIKTYGQMPRQLFAQPMRQRSTVTFASHQNQAQLERLNSEHGREKIPQRKVEPLRQVRGLKWGSYVGSPDEQDIVAVNHVRLGADKDTLEWSRGAVSAGEVRGAGSRRRPRASLDRFQLVLLANGDVAIMRKCTSLIMDCRADKSCSAGLCQPIQWSSNYRGSASGSGAVGSTSGGQSSSNSSRHEHRAGLSNMGRMNLFSHMIISRQQFSFLEPAYSPASQLDSLNSHLSSPLASLTGSLRGSKFSQDSLTLVKWNHGQREALIEIKNPATSNQSRYLPLMLANNEVDKMESLCSVPELNLLLIGYRSGAICANIISSTHELASLSKAAASSSSSSASTDSSQLATSYGALGYAAPSAIHFLGPNGARRPPDEQPNESRSSLSSATTRLAGATSGPSSSSETSGASGARPPLAPLQLPINKTSRWLYCHYKKVNCIKISVSFGIVVTGSDDGTSVIWDLNSLTYVRTIDYKVGSLVLKNQCTNLATGEAVRSHRLSSVEQDYLSWNYGRANISRLYDYLCRCRSSCRTRSASEASTGTRRTPTRQQQQKQQRRQANSAGASPADKWEQQNNNNNNWSRTATENNNSYTAAAHSSASPQNNGSARCCICCSGISLIAISDTLGDIVTVKNFSDRLARATTDDTEDACSGSDWAGSRSSGKLNSSSNLNQASPSSPGHSLNSNAATTTTSNEPLMRTSSHSSSWTHGSDLDVNHLTSVVYVHTINGSLIGYINCHTQVTAVTYSNAPEGVSVNVIVVGMSDGLIRLYSSWDLCRVKEFRITDMDSPVSSMLYSRDSQLLYIVYDDDRMVVLRNKKKGSPDRPKEWLICDKVV